MHVIFAMSPAGEDFRRRLRVFPALVNCTTIDWFLEWPKKALLTVATQFLKKVDVPQDVKKKLKDICQKTHKVVKELSDYYLLEQRRHNYVTPTSYLTLLKQFNSLLYE